MPLSAAASSFAERPSTTKLLERLRWLLTESPTPGTADVSGNICVAGTLVGETPGTSSAASRKLRPLSGRLRTSSSGMVPAIWLRAASRTVVPAVTATSVFTLPTAERDGQFEGCTGRERQRLRRIAKPRLAHGDDVRADLQVGEPEASLGVGAVFAVTLVATWRAVTSAPRTTAPDGSTTRPPMLARSTDCCAGLECAHASTAHTSPRTRTGFTRHLQLDGRLPSTPGHTCARVVSVQLRGGGESGGLVRADRRLEWTPVRNGDERQRTRCGWARRGPRAARAGPRESTAARCTRRASVHSGIGSGAGCG